MPLVLTKSTRYVILVLSLILTSHFLLSATHEPYNRATSISSLTAGWRKEQSQSTDLAVPEQPGIEPLPKWAIGGHSGNSTRANATFVMLARNSDVNGAVQSIRSIEDRFNENYGYPYVFLNEEPFTDDFKKRVSAVTRAPVSFGVIPHEFWYQPDWIDEAKAKAGRKKLQHQGIIYAGSVSYRNMCRFNSGFFFKHELLLPYKWYWRIEPDVHFHCSLTFDPFLYMEEQKKVYSFTIALYEWAPTIPTLWDTVKDFIKKYPEYVAPRNAMGFVSDDGGEGFNMCHFWSNFEIADMDFWRGEIYTKFFEFLDATGGFYYERWGDAPVHSIAAALFLDKSKIHFFNEIGYEHPPNQHCPTDNDVWTKGMCGCDPGKTHDYNMYSCQRQWDRIFD